MEVVPIPVEPRGERGKQSVKRLRRGGWTPGVYYRQKLNLLVKVSERALIKLKPRLERGKNLLVKLEGLQVEDPQFSPYALVRDVQWHPVRDEILHLDFQGVDLEEEVFVEVPLRFVGTPRGVVVGGQFEVLSYVLPLYAPIRAVPDEWEVDVSGLEIGDVLHAGDVPLPEGFRLGTDAGFPLAHVVKPAAKEEAEEEATAEAPAPSPAEGAEGEGKS